MTRTAHQIDIDWKLDDVVLKFIRQMSQDMEEAACAILYDSIPN